MAGPASSTALRFDHVTVRFDEVTALDDVSLEIFEGESCVILGAAASGKTVLLKTALGLIRPDAGRVYVFGREITRLPEDELQRIRARIGMVFQEGGLFDSLTVEENVAYPLRYQPGARYAPEEVRRRVEEALRFVELEHTLEKFPSELSGGMRRRVGIARAVVTEPDLLLYDSPTAGLDPITAYTIMALILKERDTRRATTVVVTQRYQDGVWLSDFRYNPSNGRLELAAGDGEVGGAATRFVVFREGRLAFQGSRAELEGCADPYVAKFARR
ncbi:MAG: ATP-binding cassette domain-containing protein [Bryobacterales bacterium]|nr:ATP-binding cassette domain-containing protein [Bryobacteraceae bacterium]MDW8354861.1 ATP-binding cassette domain-containing protein [Bryobacterales bacterium]